MHLTNLHMIFSQTYQGVVQRSSLNYHQLFPKHLKILVNMRQNRPHTVNLEFLTDIPCNGQIIQKGDLALDVPMSVLHIHVDDVIRITKQIQETN